MFVLVETLEGAEPVLQSQEGLFMRIYLSKELLQEWRSQIEASQGIMLLDKRLELLEIHLIALS